MNIAQAHSTLRILMVGAEMAPWAKVGGLGDVLGALPSALEKEGAQVVVCLPFYSRLKQHIKDSKPLHRRPFWMHWGGMQSFQYWLRQARHPGGFELLLVDCPALYDRPGIYHSPGSHEEYSDNLLRWTTLCHAALTGSYLLGGEWDVVHAHDMHAALTLPLMRERHSMSPLANAVGVLSIHNLAYQGNYPLSALKQIGLQSADVRPFGPYEFYGRFNCLKAGIEFADGIHTVSPTYANEIISNEEIGFGLRGVLWGRRQRVKGILNGIDTQRWNPSIDPMIDAHFDEANPSGKEECRKALLKLCGWSDEPRRPLIGLISRLTEQKGIDVFCQALPELIPLGARFVLLGNGDPSLEQAILSAMERWPDSIFTEIAFSEKYAHQIQAGADMLLMPSRFEPCGLTQMYAMRYGTLPVAHRTGGLADTILSYDEQTGKGNGFLFSPLSPRALIESVARACVLWKDEPTRWVELVQLAMGRDFSWTKSARTYIQWYEHLLQHARHPSSLAF